MQVTPAGYKKEFEWLKEVDSLALANTQLQTELYDKPGKREHPDRGKPSLAAEGRDGEDPTAP